MSRSRRRLRAENHKLREQAAREAILIRDLANALGREQASHERTGRELARWKPTIRVEQLPREQMLGLQFRIAHSTLAYARDPRAIIDQTVEDARRELLRHLEAPR